MEIINETSLTPQQQQEIVVCQFCGKKLQRKNLYGHFVANHKVQQIDFANQSTIDQIIIKALPNCKMVRIVKNIIVPSSQSKPQPPPEKEPIPPPSWQTSSEWKCDACERVLSTKDNSKRYIKSCTARNRKLTCIQCGKVFKILHGKKKFKCHCGKAFVRKDGYLRHQNTHKKRSKSNYIEIVIEKEL